MRNQGLARRRRPGRASAKVTHLSEAGGLFEEQHNGRC